MALLAILLLAAVVSPMAADGSRIFLQIGNLTDILRQISLIGIISLAMTLVILTGGIDLSVGSTLALSTAIAAMCLTRAWPHAAYASHIALAIRYTSRDSTRDTSRYTSRYTSRDKQQGHQLGHQQGYQQLCRVLPGLIGLGSMEEKV